MHPVLFELPFVHLKVHSYGLLVALGFLAAMAWIRYQAPRAGLPAGKMLDLAFLMLLVALLGSRLAYLVVEWRHFLKHPGEIVQIWEGGLVFYGGLILCIPAAYYYTRRQGFAFLKVADLFMPGVALGHALGRLGCFLAGCCYGKQCAVGAWYAAIFPSTPGSLAPAGVPLFPTQLMEAASELIIFLLLAWKSRKKGFDGQILLLYLMAYAILRFGIEFLRGDRERGLYFNEAISFSQILSILLFVCALSVLLYRRRRSA